MPDDLTLNELFQTDLNAQLNDWAAQFGPRFVLGLSGGGDSMALALGCAHWMALGNGFVHAVCVDHGLRDEAEDEAHQTVAWAQALGLTAQVLSLRLERGQTRVQERARQARHGALLHAAKAQNARVILLAHNQDDQHETVALRLTSKTGLDGLAGMSALSPSPFYANDWPCLIGRPLLTLSRKTLRDVLISAGQEWHEDPSNSNNDFARIRARSRLSTLSKAGTDNVALSRIARLATMLRQKNDEAARSFLASINVAIDGTTISLSALSLDIVSSPTFERALSWLTFAVGGGARLPEANKISRLTNRLKQPEFRGATLAGARFALRGESLIISHAPLRKAQKHAALHKTPAINLRLHAISGNLEQFVTYLG
jgi:tRNA(Ile)-lysidine synthase